MEFKMKMIFLASLTCLVISGCAPIVMSSGPRSITYDNVMRTNIDQSQKMADEHCQKYNRYAVPTSYGDFNVTYECKE